MNPIKTISLLLLSFLFIGTLNADCLDDFHADNGAAVQEYGADLERCGQSRMCLREANLSYSSNIEGAANNYGTCCDNGGSGCPPES